jgi:hypothetical protein
MAGSPAPLPQNNNYPDLPRVGLYILFVHPSKCWRFSSEATADRLILTENLRATKSTKQTKQEYKKEYGQQSRAY